MGWLRYSPSNFVFSAKLPKAVTHEKKLGLRGDFRSDLEAFWRSLRPAAGEENWLVFCSIAPGLRI